MDQPSAAEQPDAGSPEPPETLIVAPRLPAGTATLETTNVVLDTEVFYSEVFAFDQRHFRDLAQHAAEGHIALFITDISDQEIRVGIGKRVADAATVLSGSNRTKARILSNLPDFLPLFAKVDWAAAAATLVAQFDAFKVRAGITTLSSRTLPLGPLFDRYFTSQPPFESSGAKKSEFPDAAIVACLVDWTERESLRAYVISGDSGLRAACAESARLLPLSSIAEVLALTTATYDPAFLRSAATEQFKLLQRELISQVASEFQDLEFTWADSDYDEADVRSFDEMNVTLGEPLLTDITGTIAYFEVSARVSYRATVHYDDAESIHHDREDGRSYVFNRMHAQVTGRAIVPVIVELEFDPSGGTDAQIVAVAVNDGHQVEIDPETVEVVGSDLDDQWDAHSPPI